MPDTVCEPRSTAITRRFHSPPQAAKVVGVSAEKVRCWIGSGELAAVNLAKKPGGRPRWFIRDADLEAFLATRASVPRDVIVPANVETGAE